MDGEAPSLSSDSASHAETVVLPQLPVTANIGTEHFSTSSFIATERCRRIVP